MWQSTQDKLTQSAIDLTPTPMSCLLGYGGDFEECLQHRFCHLYVRVRKRMKFGESLVIENSNFP